MRIAKALLGDRLEADRADASQYTSGTASRIGARSAGLLARASIVALGSAILAQPAFAQADAQGSEAEETTPVSAEEVRRDGDGDLRLINSSRTSSRQVLARLATCYGR